MGALKIKKRGPPWQRVTNAIVMQFALADCIDCKGGGELDDPRRPCPCADAPFKKAYEGRLRRTKEGRLEYRALAMTSLLDVAAGAEATGTGIHEKVTRD
jgi:hypothetical protein